MVKWRVVWTWAIVLISSLQNVFTNSIEQRLYDVIKELNPYIHINEERVAPDVTAWLAVYNEELQQRKHNEAVAEYNYLTNMTTETLNILTEVQVDNMQWERTQVSKAKQYLSMAHIQDQSHKRMLKLITGNAVVSNKEQVNKKITELRGDLEKIYGTTKVHGKTLDDLELEIIKGSYDDKLGIWLSWRNAVGPKMRPKFAEFIKNQNIAAKDSGFTNMKEAWLLADYGYETKNLETIAEKLFEDILPLYKQLHAYVRRKLYIKYPHHIDLEGPIPAHLLGNMWAQQWDNVDADIMPYPDAPLSDVTAVLKKKYTPKKMFKLAEAFFESIGLNSMTDTFWKKSMLSRPSDREVQCHASASDMYESGDFRIKMCTNINQDDLFTIHHEMGHIQYFMEYAKQPTIFRSGANAAFHEAIGDTIALSVSTPKHFETIRLLTTAGKRNEASGNCVHSSDMPAECKAHLNFLMSQALQKIAFLPFGYLIDKYRWRIFTGDVNETNYNRMWWKMRTMYQGVSSPVQRNETDFDPGAKYHVAANVPYIRKNFARDITKVTISSWIIQTIRYCLQNCSEEDATIANVRAHDIRALAASWAFKHAVPLEDIMTSCSWKAHDTFISFYLKDVALVDTGGCTNWALLLLPKRYFFSFITQFQFYKAMCDASGHEGPIYMCDFYNSKKAGKLLKSMLELGQSKPWQDAMETITGQRDFNAYAINEYFRPLMDWLVIENNKEHIGWSY